MSHAHPASGHASDSHAHGAHGNPPVRVNPAAVTFPPGAGRGLSALLLLIGAGAIVATVIGGLALPKEVGIKHAVSSYHVGFIFALGLSLGSLGMVMILNQFNAGWTATLRRQLENAARLIPVCAVLGLPILAIELAYDGVMFKWMSNELLKTDHLLQHKSGYLNEPFFVARAILYFLIWSVLGTLLYNYSRKQDDTGDRNLSAKARFISSFGLVLFALSTAFAGFDWLMSADFHWFSTMWGVYFFAGNQVACIALLILVAVFLRRAGKLEGMVTSEHFHDLGKLLLAFTVFWAYIGFSQYFLIWYSNIPEETAWFVLRNSHGWQNAAWLLCVGHFIVPFLILLWRAPKRTPLVLGAVAAWILLMHAVDIFFIVRPNLTLTVPAYETSTGLQNWWIDLTGFVGPVALFLGLLVRQIVANPLIPMKDPRLAEALEHKNYV